MEPKTTQTHPVDMNAPSTSEVAGALVGQPYPTGRTTSHWILEDAQLAFMVRSIRGEMRRLATLQGDSSGTDDQLAIEAIVRLGYARTPRPASTWAHFRFIAGWTCRCIALSASLEMSITSASRNRGAAA